MMLRYAALSDGGRALCCSSAVIDATVEAVTKGLTRYTAVTGK